MTDEQGRVLDLVAEGKISVDEAERLLSVLADTQDAGSAHPQADLGDLVHREVISVVMEHDGETSGEALHDDSFVVGELPRVVVKNDNGRVKCEVGDDEVVRVSATMKNPRSVKYDVSQDGDVITVEAKSKGKASLLGFLGQGGSADIVVVAPRKTVLDVGTSNGVIEVSGFESESSIKSTNGRLAAQGMIGRLDASSTNGRISLNACEGDLIVRSTNGRIAVEDAQGSINASTVNGRLSFSGELVSGGSSELKTVNGRVDVRLLGQVSLKIEASGGHGRLKSDLPGLEVTGRRGRKLEGTVGEGEAELMVRTVNGGIRIN
jgi:DUF4097 and DUF4098 domain-containing protein YvlB